MTRKRLRILCGLLAVAAAALAVFLAASWLCIGWTDEGADDYPGGIVLRDAAGNVLRVSLGPGDVDCRPFYTASPDDWIVKALVASEDGTFWSHRGVRPLSVLRATWQNVVFRRRISGASTITMQAVRLIRPHPKTLWWKWKEAVMALKMERAKDKRWILSQYLNRAPFGSNFIGIESAARGWFGKGATDLGLGEAAMLAGMVQAPSRFRPDRGYDKAIRRRDYVLSRMLELGLATEEQVEGAKSVRPVVCRSPRPFAAPYFCDWYLAELGRGRSEAQRRSGDIVTTLDADVQAMCEHAVGAASERGGYSVAAVVVVAMACSGDYFDAEGGQVNTALARRPAGSTLKPFLSALAIERGFATPERRLADEPTAFRGYRPANFDGRHRGSVTLRDALVLSLNIPFVRLANEVGLDAFADNLRDLGFARANDPDARYGLGMAIGNVDVSLLELVRAYSVVARGGGDVFAPGTAYLVSDMLSGTERAQAALGHVADVTLPRFAWKTGTSSAYRDAWTVAWNPEYVVGVWCGHKSGGFGDTSLVGARAAAPVAWQIARLLYPQADGPWFVEPGDVVRRRVCSLTGLPASPDCPETEEGRAVRGRSSPALCTAHRRGPDGKLLAAKEKTLVLVRPEEDATFHLVPGGPEQRIVCQVGENAARLWWFVDGAPATPEAVSLFAYLRSIGLDTCLISNNKEERVKSFADDVGSKYQFKAGKPKKKGYIAAMEMMGTDRDSTIFIGDQIFTDIWGANRAGIPSCRVLPINSREEIQIVLKRFIEKPILKAHSLSKKKVDYEKR